MPSPYRADYVPVPRSIRRHIIARDQSTCQRCGQRTDKPEVDHIVPDFLGGTSRLSNLQVLCHLCHSSKSAKEARQGKKKKREQLTHQRYRKGSPTMLDQIMNRRKPDDF